MGAEVGRDLPRSQLCLQPPGLGAPREVQDGSPRLAAQVQRCPSTTTHCSCRAATVSPQAGEQTPTPHPLVGIYALGTWSRPGPLLRPGSLLAPSQGGLCALHGCGPERASITRQGCGKSLAAPVEPVVGPLGG